MKRTLLGLTAVTLFFAACKKDDASPGTYYLSKLIEVGEDGNDTTLISYNADNTFKEKYTAYTNNGQLEYYAEGPVYEGGKIVAIRQKTSQTPDHYVFSFVYTGNLVTRKNVYWDNDQDGTFELAPIYDSLVYKDGKLSEYWALRPDNPGYESKYLITWEGNNVKTSLTYRKQTGTDFVLEETKKYTYDNKPGFQQLLGNFNWLNNMTSFEYLSANNLLKVENYREDILRSSSTNVYTYEDNLLKVVDSEDKYIDPPSTETYKVKFEYITK